jgi:hypothetical protein
MIAANERPYVRAKVVDRNRGEYSAYNCGSRVYSGVKILETL